MYFQIWKDSCSPVVLTLVTGSVEEIALKNELYFHEFLRFCFFLYNRLFMRGKCNFVCYILILFIVMAYLLSLYNSAFSVVDRIAHEFQSLTNPFRLEKTNLKFLPASECRLRPPNQDYHQKV